MKSKLMALLASALILVLALSGPTSAQANGLAQALLGNTTNSSTSVDLEAFRLPDGTLPILCFDADNDASGDETHHHACDQCCLTAQPKPATLQDAFVKNVLERSGGSALRSDATPLSGWIIAERYHARAPPVPV